ncbi:MAG: flagellar M-ring protein FliF [Deltaproteobacteria bacterium]|nr:flagellar M-ring protein FliF [Deltaproteobacteria bacterium]
MTSVEFFNKIRTRFEGMSMSQRVGVLALIGFVVAIFIVTLMWVGAPKYQYLFTDLGDADASIIVQRLKEDRIPYKLTKGGSAIMIPGDKVYETRLTLAGEGLPKGGSGKGFALFDETSFSTSEFVQKINYQRALQNEIAKTIMALDEIDFARVHIVLPKESVFIEDEKPAKASIIIRSKPGYRVKTSQVQGIVYLVTKSVRGLEPGNVSIVDVTGKVLYGGREDDTVSFAKNHLEMKYALEGMLQTRAQEMLEKILGPGKAVVKVGADINMDMVKSTEETYDPEGRVIRSEEIKTEAGGGGGVPGGIAGTQSNLPTGRGGANVVLGNAGGSSSDIIRNYEITRSQTELVKSPGEIDRLTVSVVVDGTYKTDNDGKKIFVTRSKRELKEIEEAVKHAIGFNPDRDDTIAVSCIPFATEGIDIEGLASAVKKMELLKSLVKPGVFFLVVLLLLLFVVRPIVRWLTGSVKVIEEAPEEKAVLEGEERGAIETSEEIAKIESAMAKSEDMKQAVQGWRKDIEDIARGDVESAVAVVRNWLHEEG